MSLETFTDEFPRPAGSSLHLAGIIPAIAKLDRKRWAEALSLDEFIEQATVHKDLWQSTRRLAPFSDANRDAVETISAPLSLLVLLEDWCGDAIHTVPVVQRLVDANPLLTLRVLKRDENDDLMATHLTGASRAIPVIMVFDADGIERGWWGPRPTPLQSWVLLEGRDMEKNDRYKAIRTWYARDRGATTASEVLQLIRHAATPRG
jgi:hypothetical protein